MSIITEMELMRGAKSSIRKKELGHQLKAHHLITLDHEASLKASNLMKKYISGNQNVFIADCFIAATAMTHEIPLLTYNIKDFDFLTALNSIKHRISVLT